MNEYQYFLLRKCFRDLLDKRRASKNYNFYQKNNTQDAAKEKIFIFGVAMDNEYSTFLHTFVRLIQSDQCRKKKKVA